jgi:CRISPR/Cas system CSM-associated protein Csm3 (group 7 of RAMP superfamily)
MFRKLYNRALIEAEIEPDGPVLVVEGGLPLDPMAPALAFVRTIHAGEPTVYLPGSSLKGVVRAHAERLLVTEIGETAAEDPFDDGPGRTRAKEARKANPPDRPAVYRASCEADRLFGSTEVAGRFRIADALPTPETLATANRTEIRFSVSIDRAKQSVRHGPFDQEAVTGGRFRFRAAMENYELWMLALVLQVLRDLDDGFVQIGHAKTRGFGTVRVREPHLRLLWPGERPASLQGAGARESSEETRREYGLVPNDEIPFPDGHEDDASGLFSGVRITGWDGLHSLADALGEGPWREYADRLRQEESNGQ